MKKYLNIILPVIGVFIAIFFASVAYFAVGGTLFGPKTEVAAVCQTLEPNMSVSNALTLASQYEGMDAFVRDDFDATNTATGQNDVLQISKVSNGWICVCNSNLEPDGSGTAQIASVDSVFCSD